MKIVFFSIFLSLTANAQGLISLRKNKEILRTYEELTGIKMDSEIQRVYDSSFISLPKNGDVTELNGFTLISMINLSQTFCNKLIQKERTLAPEARWVLNHNDLEKEVITWSDSERTALIHSMAELFWNETPDAQITADISSIFQTMSELEQPLAQSAALSTTCTAMLMSPLVYTK